MVAIVYASIVSIYIHIYTYKAILYINKWCNGVSMYTNNNNNNNTNMNTSKQQHKDNNIYYYYELFKLHKLLINSLCYNCFITHAI